MTLPLRRPLGLALAGGGAHGAWQAGALAALLEAGLKFDKVTGFSVGSLTGLAYFLGLEAELFEQWQDIESRRMMRLQPRLSPAALFSNASLWEAVRDAADEERAKKTARCELTVISLDRDDNRPHYARFTPGAAGGWDGPLDARVVASCTVPLIWPAVTIGENGSRRSYIDGGVVGRETIRFDSLSGCKDVLVLQMVRQDERRESSSPLPWRYLDQKARNIVLLQMDSGVASLQGMAEPPRVLRLEPSRPLDYQMLDFDNRRCRPAYALGYADASAFLASA